jgi:hypothetical protein
MDVSYCMIEEATNRVKEIERQSWHFSVDGGFDREVALYYGFYYVPHGASADFRDNEGGIQLMLVSQEHLISFVCCSRMAWPWTSVKSTAGFRHTMRHRSNPRSLRSSFVAYQGVRNPKLTFLMHHTPVSHYISM